MKINIETIPHDEQRYPDGGRLLGRPRRASMQVRVSDYEGLALRSVSSSSMSSLEMFPDEASAPSLEQAISDFDIKFEQSRSDLGVVLVEPGDQSLRSLPARALLRDEPGAALSAELDVDWFEYDRDVDALGYQEIALSSRGTRRSMLNVTVSHRSSFGSRHSGSSDVDAVLRRIRQVGFEDEQAVAI